MIVVLAILVSQLVYLALTDGRYGFFGFVFGLLGLDQGRKLALALFGGKRSALQADPFPQDTRDLGEEMSPEALGLCDPFAYYGLGNRQTNLAAREMDREFHCLIE